MKLVRYGPAGREKPGMIDGDGRLRDLAGVIDDITPDTLGRRGLALLRRVKPARLPLLGNRHRLGPPVAGIGKLVATPTTRRRPGCPSPTSRCCS